ncbi:MAG: CoA-binding protein [Armatimonadota bacterium]|nr:CoA-binding protein [Armatimonadota bacterium]
MLSSREQFWQFSSFAVIGDSQGKRRFPRCTYRGLKVMGKIAYAVDPGMTEIDGDPAYRDLSALPAPVEAAVLEVAPSETAAWVRQIADAGIRNLWIHWGTETPEALALAAEKGMRVETGTCAAMYVNHGLNLHSPHRWIMKLLRRY